MSEAEEILRQLDTLIETRARNPGWLQGVCALLQFQRPHFNWVGFYFLDGQELALGAYVGAPTPHTRIALDKGICGAAVRERRTLIVPDVGKDPRYLACSLETKSEIVVPLEAEGRIFGELDIDSHTLNAFQAEDHQLLQAVARRLAPILAREPVAPRDN
jgi:L-methionine (R)-S-oxide reductase